jgi:hypothetical protein
MNAKLIDYIEERLTMLNQELVYLQTDLEQNAVKMTEIQFGHNLHRRNEIAGAIRELLHLKTRIPDWE